MGNTILLQAPAGLSSIVSSQTLQTYTVTADGFVTVDPADVTTLLRAGFQFPGLSAGNAILTIETDNITAHAGGTQAAALLLTSLFNRVTTVGTAADSVKLPPATAGMEIMVINDASANSLQVFGSGTDTIDGVATATGVAQAAAKRCVYRCVTAGKWYSLAGAKTS